SYMQNTILNVLPTSSASIPDLQHQLYMKMKTDLQSQATDSDVWNARKAKESKTTSSEQPKQQEYDAWFEIPKLDDDEVISKDATPEFLDELKSFDMKVPTIVDHKRMKATLKDMMSNQFRNAEEYAYHLDK
ncbi:hypothetical protein Tco_1119009, partial [Tanacetum coccineum]